MEESELLCRVCFKENGLLVNIFEIVEEHQTNLISLLETHGGLKTESENDSLPKYLCDECTNELLITTKFRKKCTQTANKFKQLQTAATADALFKPTPLDSIEISSQLPEDLIDDNLDLMNIIIETSPNEEEEQEIIVDNMPEENNFCTETTEEIIETSLTELISLPQEHDQISSDTSLAPVKVKGQSSLVCDICGACFVKSISLQRHIENFHQQVDFFTCSFCKHIFSKESNLKEHNCSAAKQQDNFQFKEPKGKTNTKLNRNCSHCGKSFKSSFALEMHIRTHTGERPFVCNFCEKAFKTKSALDNHINAHTGFLKYKCSHCEKSFTDNSNLKRHTISHTGEKPHVCTICKKSFARVFLLEYHMRTHTGERPFVCNICQKGFTQRSTLRYHECSHTGKSKYQCSVCQKSFGRRYLLQKHLETQHPECPLMKEEVTDEPPLLMDQGDLNWCLPGYECEVTTDS